MSEPVLAVQSLTVRYGKRTVVENVSFELERGELCALIGPNGAGKSTLLNVVTGHLRPSGGKVFFNGKRIDGVSPARLARLGLARTFQVTTGFPSLTAAESIAVPLRSLSADTKSILEKFGLEHVASIPTMEMSYGDIKKLDLAIALSTQPSLLLLDEPTAGIGAGERHELLTLVEQLNAAGGLTVLFCEHDTDLVFSFASRVLVMHQGRFLEQGSPEQIRLSPAVREVYLGGAV